MIIVKLMGGLGNQMFQYAAGRCLAEKHGTMLKMDTTFLNAPANGIYTQRKYELNSLRIDECFATVQEVNSFRDIQDSYWKRKINSLLPRSFQKYYAVEKSPGYQEVFMKYPKNTYLEGYWQSECYFKPVENILRKEFSFLIPLTGKDKELSEEIQAAESIAVHIRRTDYVTHGPAKDFHGVCGMDYYERGIREIAGRLTNPKLFIFSDDPEWVRENFTSHYPTTFVSHHKNDNGAYDLRLMSLCRHAVIANSSFSWWGAWLIANPGKVIVAPEKWFTDSSIPIKDRIPAGWIKL